MSRIFEQKPSIVKVSMSYQVDDGNDETTDRYIVGYTLDEVIEAVTLSLDGAEHKTAAPTRKTHKRRTKAELAAANQDQKPDAAEPVPAGAGADKAWP